VIDELTEIVDGVIEREGGFVDHPADKGGPTRWGITQAVARDSNYRGPMEELPREAAVSIYWDQFIEGPGFKRICPISPRIALKLIDTGVNMGSATVGIFFQRALNVFNGEERHYPEIKVDGQCGPQTRGALRAFLEHRGELGEEVMTWALATLQGESYIAQAEAKPSQEAFAFGWFVRLIETTQTGDDS